MKKLLMALLLIGFVFGCATTDGAATDGGAAEEEVVEKVITPKEKTEVLNGDFSMGDAEWETDATAGGKATFSVVDEVMVVDITAPGKENWSIGMYSMLIPIEKGTDVTVSFDIKADAPTVMSSSMGIARAPWTSFGVSGDKEIGTEWQTVTYTYNAFKNEKKAQFALALGASTATKIYIDNVVVSAAPAAE